MAEVINLDDLIPKDIVLSYQGEEFIIPGDLDTETVLKIFRTFRELLSLTSIEEPDEDDLRKAATELEALLLEVFRIKNPDLKRLPFGSKSTPIVVQHLLASLGVNLGGESDVPDPPPANRSQRRSSPTSPKAPRKKS